MRAAAAAAAAAGVGGYMTMTTATDTAATTTITAATMTATREMIRSEDLVVVVNGSSAARAEWTVVSAADAMPLQIHVLHIGFIHWHLTQPLQRGRRFTEST